MQKSSIEWTDMTWGVARGCDDVSPGCDNCYARKFAERWRGTPGNAYENGFDLRLAPHLLERPLRILKSQRIFVNSMSDLFHKGIPREFIADVGYVMRMAQWHTFQTLTKRSSRMRTLLNGSLSDVAGAPNIWWGVSVEDRKHGLPRIRHLQEITNAKVRWLSIEPLLEDLGKIDLTGIHGVVVGGESGPRARPMEEAWVMNVLHQCENQDVPFFFKQWGGVFKKKTGRRLMGKTFSEQPERSTAPVLPRPERKQVIAHVRERTRYWLEQTKFKELIFRLPERQQIGLERLGRAASAS